MKEKLKQEIKREMLKKIDTLEEDIREEALQKIKILKEIKEKLKKRR